MQQKNIKVWQFIVLGILLVAMLATMFMPAFGINGASLKKMVRNYEEILGKELASEFLEEVQVENEKIDASIAETEKEYGIKLRNITPLDLMILNLSKLMQQDQEPNFLVDETSQKIVSGYNLLRIPLIVIYILTVAILIFLIISFFMKINKVISLSICITYGVISGGVFGFLRFGLLRIICSKIARAMGDLGALFGSDLGTETSDIMIKYMTKFLSPLNSVAFLIAMILAIVLLIMSIVCIFVGNTEDSTHGFTDGGEWELEERKHQEEEVRRRREEEERRSWEEEERRRHNQLEKNPPVGVVQCIKGVALGQGFRVPADRKVVIGKSAQRANLIVNDPKVSNVHCSIRYNPQNATYVVIDHSSNGTYVNGTKLQKEMAMVFNAGTVISLAGDDNQIKLG